MRINLVTPFAEKDAVKALGARWDPAQKLWYITDVADLTPFMRWIPDLESASEPSGGAAKAPAKSNAKAPARQSKGVITKFAVAVPGCGCQVLPWVDCEHRVSALDCTQIIGAGKWVGYKNTCCKGGSKNVPVNQ